MDDAEDGKLGACTPAGFHDPMYRFVGKVHLGTGSSGAVNNLVFGRSEDKKKESSASDNGADANAFFTQATAGSGTPYEIDRRNDGKR